MTHSQKKTAVILFNLGGPDKLENVKPFLFNLFNDKAIINLPQPLRFFLAKFISGKREKKAQAIYQSIGGKSPLLAHSIDQSHSLEKELSHFGNFKTFVSMRYAPPFSEEIVEEVLKYNPDEAILLPLYPQFSTTTSESSLNDFAKKITQKAQSKINLKFVCCYPDDPNFIKSHALLIKQTLSQSYDNNLDEFEFLFSAHGLPQKVINGGDPYVFQVEKTTQKVVEHLATLLRTDTSSINHQICFQSKVGPMQWTGPSLDFSLKKTILKKKIPVVIPIALVSEHSETLAELDIEYKEIAQSLGAKNYLRVPALNADGHFIQSLTDICQKVSRDNSTQCFSGQKRDRICPKKFIKCPNFNSCKQ